MREATRGLTLRDIIEHMLAETGLIDFYRADKEGADRVENLEELMNAAEAFVTQEGFGRDAVALPVDELAPGTLAERNTSRDVPGLALLPTRRVTPDAETGEIMSPLAAFLTHASLEAGDNQAQAGQDAIQLMTIHSAKGLEFDCVFITGLEEGLFPHENSLQTNDGLEEERRLMYVAITRARKRLYLSFSQTRLLHGQTRYNVKSRFVDELPEANVRWLTPRNQAFGSGYAREYKQAWERGTGPGLDDRRRPRRVAAGAAGDAGEPLGHQQQRPRAAPGPVRLPHQVRRGRDHDARRQRRGGARAGQLRRATA